MRSPARWSACEPAADGRADRGLAPIVVEQLAQAIKAFAPDQGMAVVLVEQHAELALEFAPRSNVMFRGRIVYDGPSAALAADQERLHGLVGVAR